MKTGADGIYAPTKGKSTNYPFWEALSETLLIDVLVKIIPLVIDDDERREVFNLDAPHGLHAHLFKIQHFDLEDVFARQNRGGAADRSEVEAAVLAAGFLDRGGSIPLGEHDQ